jgi:tryptophan-rich sensory protein
MSIRMAYNNDQSPNTKKPALPKKWIVPIKLAVMAALAGCSAFVYFNVRDLQTTQIVILLSIVLVCAMVWLDCKMSERYWEEQEKPNT